ncbi:JmjC domain, hydroxylase-domain-containing protein, partial [Blastocladiella britannica]
MPSVYPTPGGTPSVGIRSPVADSHRPSVATVSERPPACFFSSLVTPVPNRTESNASTTTAPTNPNADPAAADDTTSTSGPTRRGTRHPPPWKSVDLDAEIGQSPDFFVDDLLTVRLDPEYIRTVLEPKYWSWVATAAALGCEKDASAPVYGADLQGTLWPSDVSPPTWNTNNLDKILHNGIGKRVPGVNTPYLYFGTWRATFGWHSEDMDLYSINYLHFGAPKCWYAIAPQDSDNFFTMCANTFPADSKRCKEFVRHKALHMTPEAVERSCGIKVHRMVQEKNEFVITFPRGAHAGWNAGFNCAESLNFALPRWFELGKVASSCMCESD